MRKSRTYGSVRGAPGNRRSYRDLGSPAHPRMADVRAGDVEEYTVDQRVVS